MSTGVYVNRTADPSAGAGVAAGIGTIYLRDNAGVGELWEKTGAGNTAWTKVSTGAYVPGGTDVAVADGGTGAGTAAGARTNLGLVIGTDVAAPSAITATKLDDFAAPDDNTDLNATTGVHGLLPKLGGGSTNFLRADGTWNAPAGGAAGGLVLLEQHTASASATLDFTAFISATYDEYLFELLDVLPATNSSQLWMRVRSGGSFISASKYQTSAWVWVYNGQTATGNAIGALVGQITTSNANDQWNGAGAAAGTVGQVRLFNPQSTGAYKRITYEIGFHESSTGMMKGSSGRAIYADTPAIDGFQFLFNSGNIASGIIRVYGIAKT